ncbi:hypothetical protein V1281_005161 [Nitrobacteraceae bacterium AZCC 2161]
MPAQWEAGEGALEEDDFKVLYEKFGDSFKHCLHLTRHFCAAFEEHISKSAGFEEEPGILQFRDRPDRRRNSAQERPRPVRRERGGRTSSRRKPIHVIRALAAKARYGGVPNANAMDCIRRFPTAIILPVPG